MRIGVIIPAAGASSRYLATGGLRSKLDEDLGGKPVLQRTVELFTKHDDVGEIIVAGPADDAAYAEFKDRHADRLGLLGAKICKGGVMHRWETVNAALEHVTADCTHIAVHDAARPCVSMELLDRVFNAARRHNAAIPAVEASDTVKRITDTGETIGGDDDVAAILGETAESRKPLRAVQETVDRRSLVLVQTPQVFEAGLLRRAYAQSDLTSTDDASIVEKLGVRVVVVDGESRNIKITRPGDLALARAILGLREPEGRPVHKRF
ncbi:MAG TPA: 2-C-methyl-D-erythritol 4-phosphate cytidylyltransferase [Phycisphaerales bacterium]|nr:2-C-methyl-D-erythritol 4-phosphate cytidylyltransferase [Phycisphaerales bacterium]